MKSTHPGSPTQTGTLGYKTQVSTLESGAPAVPAPQEPKAGGLLEL